MAREWQFFQALISNIDMVMAKADIGIARRYARLCPDLKCLAECFLKSKRWLKTRELRVYYGSKERGIRRAFTVIKMRHPCLDPLNHLQVELIRRWRSGEK